MASVEPKWGFSDFEQAIKDYNKELAALTKESPTVEKKALAKKVSQLGQRLMRDISMEESGAVQFGMPSLNPKFAEIRNKIYSLSNNVKKLL